MNERVSISGLQVAESLYRFIENQALPGTGVDGQAFWQGFADLLADLAPLNRELLAKRDAIQAQIDEWCRAQRGKPLDMSSYKAFLGEIGYLLPEGEPFEISTTNVDDEIAHVAGPQLVVPVNNARYALNAANARWGSLYDALYGTDVISEENGRERAGGYNPTRGCAVIRYAQGFLDRAIPLDGVSHGDVAEYGLAGNEFAAVVDGNVIRVLTRFLDERGDVSRAKTKQVIQAAADRLLSPGRPGDWNQAVMELGATICSPRSPGCSPPRCSSICPERAPSLPTRAFPSKPRQRPVRRTR